MRLFTINSYLDYKRQKKMETRKEFFEKYNNSLKYYMLQYKLIIIKFNFFEFGNII